MSRRYRMYTSRRRPLSCCSTDTIPPSSYRMTVTPSTGSPEPSSVTVPVRAPGPCRSMVSAVTSARRHNQHGRRTGVGVLPPFAIPCQAAGVGESGGFELVIAGHQKLVWIVDHKRTVGDRVDLNPVVTHVFGGPAGTGARGRHRSGRTVRSLIIIPLTVPGAVRVGSMVTVGGADCERVCQVPEGGKVGEPYRDVAIPLAGQRRAVQSPLETNWRV